MNDKPVISLIVTIVGDCEAGKSAVYSAYLTKKFNPSHVSTRVQKAESKNVVYKDCELSVMLVDSVSKKGMSNIRIGPVLHSDFFCIVVDATKSTEEQVKSIQKWKEDIEDRIQGKNYIVIANDKGGGGLIRLDEEQLSQAGVSEDQYCILNAEDIMRNTSVLDLKFKCAALALSKNNHIKMTEETGLLGAPKSQNRSSSCCIRWCNFFCCLKPYRPREVQQGFALGDRRSPLRDDLCEGPARPGLKGYDTL